MSLDSLKPNPKNPRKISDVKLKMLGKSLKEFGDLSGIVFNQRSKQLVGGHQRAKTLPENAQIEITKRYEPATSIGTVAVGFITVGDERHAYREVDWDETKEKAANIAANQHGGEFDIPLLTDWVKELSATGLDMDLIGFDTGELSRLMSPKEPAKEKEKPADPTPITCPSCGETLPLNHGMKK